MQTTIERTFFYPVYWPAWLVVGIFWLITRLPFHWQMPLGKLLGKLLYVTSKKMRHTAATNLQLCFPELNVAQRQTLLKQNFISIGIGIIETALGWWGSDSKLKNRVSISGLENLHNALAKGKGVLLLGAHFTSLEIIGRLFLFTMPYVVMYRPQKNAFFNMLTQRSLQRHYKTIITRDNIRGMLRALKNNSAVWYAADIDAGLLNSIFVPFFGIPAASITATPRYANISGCAVVPVSFYRRDDFSGYEIHFEPALTDFPSDNIEQDVLRVNQTAERQIRARPDQYLWQYKRFKTRLLGEARFYGKKEQS